MTRRCLALAALLAAELPTGAAGQPVTPEPPALPAPPQDPAPPPPEPKPQPEQPAEPAPPAPAATTPSDPKDDEKDDEIVGALATLFSRWASPEDRRAAIAKPFLADKRLIAPLVFLLSDGDPAVAVGAARLLGGFKGDDRVEQSLIALLRNRAGRDEVREAVAEALARQGGAPAGEALYDVYSEDGEPPAVRQAARVALAAGFPELLQRRGDAEVVDRRGRMLLSVGSAALGSYALGAVGALGQNDAGITIGVLGGALVGAGSAYFLTRTGEITPAQAGWMLTGGAWGATLGMLTAGTVDRDPSQRLVMSFGLLGEGIGFVSAVATRRRIPFTGGDVFMINLGGLLGFDLAGGSLLLSDGGDERVGRGILLGAGAAGLAAGAAITRHLRFTEGDVALTIDGALEGLVAGALVPQAATADPSSRRIWAGTLLGMGIGFVGGVALSQVTNYDSGDVAFQVVTGGYGKLLGLSLAMLADGDDRSLARATIAGSFTSLAAAHALTRKVRFGGGDTSFVALSSFLGFWHGLALGVSSDLNDRQAGGAMLLGLSAGGLGAMGLSQFLAFTPTEVLAMAGGTFWGAWIAAWNAALADLSINPALRLTLAASDAGLAIAGVLISPLVNVDPRRIGIANLGGLAGAGLASLAAALATTDDDIVIAANLIGSGIGLVGGTLLAATLNLKPLPPKAPRGPAPGPQRASSGTGLPMLSNPSTSGVAEGVAPLRELRCVG